MRHSSPTLRRFLAATTTAGLLLAASMVPAVAEEGPPSGFPSSSDVEQVKGDAKATAAEVATIPALLDSLENQAGVLGTTAVAAVAAGAGYALTQSKLDAATAEVALLNAHTRQAADAAAEYEKQAVAVQSYKSGGAGPGLFAPAVMLSSQENLNGADLMHQVGEQADLKQARAGQAQAVAAALKETRKQAQTAHAELSLAAQHDRDAALTAQSAVTERIAGQQTQSATLMAQLAALNNTSVAMETEFRQGRDAVTAYNQAQEAKRLAAEDSSRRGATTLPPAAAAPQSGAPAPKPAASAPQSGAPVGPVIPNPAPALLGPAAPGPTGGYIPGYTPGEVVVPTLPGGAVNDPAGAKNYAQSQLGAFGWTPGEFTCLNQLWERESNWRTNATNPYSGAYGIAQALPPGKYALAVADWLTNYRTQIQWGLGYISNRYGSPCGAWNHSQTVRWY